MNGYAGKILRLDLTHRKVSIIPTSDYEQWGGGHGMGSAIFFDLVKDKTIDGFDPANVVTLMTSPLCGTPVPAAGGRTEMQGIGVQTEPIGWFTRSGFGGRFSTQLKFAGWDGVVVEGKADEPVWIDIRNGDVRIRNCSELSLWGKDTRDCQETIWSYVAGNDSYGDWIQPSAREGGRTVQRPAVVTIGPAGENLSRMACLIHDAGHGSGQGGFGAIWGSKNLKAISAIGTGAVSMYDPKALLEARLWMKENYAFDLNGRAEQEYILFRGAPQSFTLYGRGKLPPHRSSACVGCHSGCTGRYEDGIGNESICENTLFYGNGNTLDIRRRACDLLNLYGVNAFEAKVGIWCLEALHKAGAFEPGTGLDCPLDYDDSGSFEFADQYLKMIAYGDDGLGNPSEFGNDLSQGVLRAVQKWGVLNGDYPGVKDSILMFFPYWGMPIHRDPRTRVEWGFGSMLGDRDINEHCFSGLERHGLPAEDVVRIFTDKMVPFDGDLRILDCSDENTYSEHMAKFISWHRYYSRFYKQSLLFCDNRWPDFCNSLKPGGIGATGVAEPRFFNAVTGKNFSFLDGIELGKKIWNLDHAIWTLQGRHRDMVHFSDSVYTQESGPWRLQAIKDGKWEFVTMPGRHLDRDGFDEFKTHFYKLQGWDTATGFPTRSTLASMGLDYVADELEAQGKLGAEARSAVAPA